MNRKTLLAMSGQHRMNYSRRIRDSITGKCPACGEEVESVPFYEGDPSYPHSVEVSPCCHESMEFLEDQTQGED